jgi:hypothetical protein
MLCIKKILGLFFYHCSIFTNETAINNEKLLRFIHPQAQEMQDFFVHRQTLPCGALDIMTGGVFLFFRSYIEKFFFNFTDLFIKSDYLENYGIYQKRRLEKMFEQLKEDKKKSPIELKKQAKTQTTDICQDIILDYLAFNGKNKIFKQNLNYFYKQINQELTENLNDVDNINIGFKRRELMLQIKFMQFPFLRSIINHFSYFCAPLNILSSPLTIHKLLLYFNYETLHTYFFQLQVLNMKEQYDVVKKQQNDLISAEKIKILIEHITNLDIAIKILESDKNEIEKEIEKMQMEIKGKKKKEKIIELKINKLEEEIKNIDEIKQKLELDKKALILTQKKKELILTQKDLKKNIQDFEKKKNLLINSKQELNNYQREKLEKETLLNQYNALPQEEQILQNLKEKEEKISNRMLILENIYNYGLFLPLQYFLENLTIKWEKQLPSWLYFLSFKFETILPTLFTIKSLMIKPLSQFYQFVFPDIVDQENLQNTMNLSEKNIEQIQLVRNAQLIPEQKIERLLHYQAFILSQPLIYLNQKISQNMENKFINQLKVSYNEFIHQTQSINGVYFEHIIIKKTDNLKLIQWLNMLRKNIYTRKNLPLLLLHIPSYQMGELIYTYIRIMQKDLLITYYKIIDPFMLTKMKIKDQGIKNKLQSRKLTQQVFYTTVQNLISFLEVHFSQEDFILNYWQKIVLYTARKWSEMYNSFKYLCATGRFSSNKIYKCLYIEFLDTIAPDRFSASNNILTHTTNLLLKYLANLRKDIFVIAKAQTLQQVDKALIDRFSVIVNINLLTTLKDYMIYIRRYLLKMYSILSLEKSTFEKFIIEISYKIYQENWTFSEIDNFFLEILKPQIFNKYNSSFNKERILNLINKGTKI